MNNYLQVRIHFRIESQQDKDEEKRQNRCHVKTKAIIVNTQIKNDLSEKR